MCKKLLTLISFSLLFLSVSCKSNNTEKNLVHIPMENREIPITYDAQKNLESSYAGYEDALGREMKVKEIRNQFLEKYNKNEKIQIEEFFQALYKTFSPYIQDSHANLSYNGVWKPFIGKHRVYFSDVYVQEKDDSYFVLSENQEKIPAGAQFADDEKYLFYYPAKGENVYRVGCLQSDYKDSISIKFDNTNFEVLLREAEVVDEPCLYFVKSTEKSAYIKYNRCDFENETELNYQKNFSNSAKNYKDKDFLIVDLRGNYGGDNSYGNKFLAELYDEKMKHDDLPSEEIRWIYSYANIKAFRYLLYALTDVNNPEIKKILKELKAYEKMIKAKPQKIIKVVEDSSEKKSVTFDNPEFTGKIILLTDKNVASSGEDFVRESDLIFGSASQVIQIGQNTSGCLLYGNISDYFLPNSGIKCRFSMTDFSKSSKQSKRFRGEGYGLFPDYWSTNEDLNDTIFFVTQDEQMYEILKDVL